MAATLHNHAVLACCVRVFLPCLQGTSDQPVDYMDSAWQHAAQAVAAATACKQPGLHAAAALALGQARMLQAHAVMLEEQRSGPLTATLPQTTSSAEGDASTTASAFDAAWLPWNCRLAPSSSARAAAGPPSEGTGGALGAPDSAAAPAAADAPAQGEEEQLSGPSAGAGSISVREAAGPDAVDDAAAGAAGIGAQGQLGGSVGQQQKPQLPAAAEPHYRQAIQHLQQALQEALQHQQLSTAEAAARSLLHCYGLLQPEQAAVCAAVAQSCSSAAAMRAVFQQAAAPQHPEVLLWRQLQQLEASCAPGSEQQLQVCSLPAWLPGGCTAQHAVAVLAVVKSAAGLYKHALYSRPSSRHAVHPVPLVWHMCAAHACVHPHAHCAT